MGVDAQMFVRTRATLTDEALRELGYRLAQCVGSCHFMHERTWREPHHFGCLQRIGVYEQDGPDIKPERGESFVEVHLFGRYYGVGYERGDPWVYIAVAEWMERAITGCEVWYGGDSSGMCAEKFDRDAREALISHWANVGHEPYRRYGDMSREAAPDGTIPVSRAYGVKMIRDGWGGDYAAFTCPASGERAVWRGGRWLTEEEIRTKERL